MSINILIDHIYWVPKIKCEFNGNINEIQDI